MDKELIELERWLDEKTLRDYVSGFNLEMSEIESQYRLSEIGVDES